MEAQDEDGAELFDNDLFFPESESDTDQDEVYSNEDGSRTHCIPQCQP